MSVFIYKNNQQYGPYDVDQLRSWVASGKFQPTDLACYAGAANWLPLSTLLAMGTSPYAVKPHGYGWLWIIGGLLLSLLGGLLTATLIGAIIGLPMLAVGIPAVIYGYVKLHRRQMWNLAESVRVGVIQGIAPQAIFHPNSIWNQVVRLVQPALGRHSVRIVRQDLTRTRGFARLAARRLLREFLCSEGVLTPSSYPKFQG